MSKKLFITGTGTDVGKTYVSGLLMKKLVELNPSAAYFKAAMSGNAYDDQGTLIPGDALFVKQTANLTQDLDCMCPYVYEQAVSPHLASRLEGNPVEMQQIKHDFTALSSTYDYVVMEGSGGIICPIRFDDTQIMLEDIITELCLPSLIVADAELGTINQVVLTVSYMKQKKLPIKGIIFNNYKKDEPMHQDNLFMCEKFTGIPVVACVAPSDADLNISDTDLLKLFE